jgi:rhodanese-related sulfurtransferase
MRIVTIFTITFMVNICKYTLIFTLGIITFLSPSLQLFSQEITGLTSLEFFKLYGERIDDGSLLLIDGRTDAMFAAEHIGKAVNIDADAYNLEELLLNHLDQPLIVVYCTTIRRTTDIVNKLRGSYNGEIIIIRDGIVGWKQNGLPLNKRSQISPDEVIEEETPCPD